MFRGCAEGARLFGGIVQTEDKDGALLWLPGPKAPLGLWRELQTSLVTLPFQIGLRQTWRLMSHDEGVMQYILQHANIHQMGYIWQ
ncbi:hypothetical protein As57867_001879, partial [Aphanomyces stellatus]